LAIALRCEIFGQAQLETVSEWKVGMSDDFELKIEITGERSLVISVADAISSGMSDEATIIETKVAQDESKQAFGIHDVSTIIAVVKGVYYLGQLAVYIYDKLQGPKTKISILTPYGSVEIRYHEKLSVDEVRAALRKAADL
jgi:TATA-binding protein-associated factor Taf7